ncbi:hypothetical protein GIB67_041205 [Kingdonia uniflora]|uniref:DNA-directed RNA polymerase n=1 Tax=Kingdonia uniflora TaxID=39325 RepID=A0A7J7N9Y4_9MAGN|nr:hypothetical protein GIB67_041205 [Kingdonia uniflora]
MSAFGSWYLEPEVICQLVDSLMTVKFDRIFKCIHGQCEVIFSSLLCRCQEGLNYNYLFALKHMEGFLKDINCRGATDSNTHEMFHSGSRCYGGLMKDPAKVALDYIGKKGSIVGITKERKIKYTKEILQREMLPHVGVREYYETKKAYYFGYIIHQLLCKLCRRPEDDRDHYNIKRLDLANPLLGGLFQIENRLGSLILMRALLKKKLKLIRLMKSSTKIVPNRDVLLRLQILKENKDSYDLTIAPMKIGDDESPVDEVLTSGWMNESNSGGEGGLEEFLGFPSQLVSYPPGSDTFKEFCKAKGAIGGKWGVKSTVERKISLLDEVVEEETELKLVLGELGLSRKKRVESKSKRVVKAQSTRSMTGVDKGKRQTSGKEFRAKTPRSGSSAQPNLTTKKLDQKFLKTQLKKVLPASGTTVCGEVAPGKRRMVKLLGNSGEKIVKGRSASMDASKRSKKGLGCSSCQGDLAEYRRTGIRAEEGKERAGEKPGSSQNRFPERSQAAKGRHLMLKGYSQEEVDAIKADTYTEEEEEEVEVLGFVDCLDGVSPQMVLENQRDDVEFPEGGSEMVEEKDFRIKRGLEDLSEATEHTENLQCQLNALDDKGHIQKGNANLRECQHKLDAALIREKVLEGEIRAKELLLKRKEELLKDLPIREELNTELGVLRAQVRHERLKARFAKAVVPDVARSDLLKGRTCGAKIDQGNRLGIMETQLEPQTSDSVERGWAAIARELKDRPLDDVGESIADTLST